MLFIAPASTKVTDMSSARNISRGSRDHTAAFDLRVVCSARLLAGHLAGVQVPLNTRASLPRGLVKLALSDMTEVDMAGKSV